MDIRRRQLSADYKAKRAVGGVYRIVHRPSGRYLLMAATDIRGAQNRFTFSQGTQTCTLPALLPLWKADGPDAFAWELLETLTQQPDQSAAQFKEDLVLLEQLWREKLEQALALYP
jgi:hypothetical protein